MQGYIHQLESFGSVDGPGVRFIIFFSGCPLRCKYCHNPDTWDMAKGKLYTADELLNEALSCKAYGGAKGGITVSGGEPLMQLDFLLELFTKAKEKTKSDKAYVSQLFRNFEQTATTNLTAKKISGLTNRLIKGTQKGFFEIQGTSKIGKALGDGIDHAEFYPDKESIIDVMTKIYGLKKRE